MFATVIGGGEDSAVVGRLSRPLVISQETFGVHLLKYPQNSTPQPAASFRYGTVRNHDWSSTTHGGTRWDQLHTGAGAFDWDALDAWIEFAEKSQKVPVYCLMGTPAWTVAAAAVGNAAYGSKTNMVPDNLSNLAAFATALATRYKDRLRYYEGWNEPNLATYYGGTDAYIASTATPAKMAEIQRTWFQALKAADPSAIVLSPCYTSVFSGTSGLGTFLAASDGAGGAGKDWLDILAYHFYCNNDSARPDWLVYMFNQIQQRMQAAGIAKPVWATEYGLITPGMVTYSNDEQRAMVRIYTLTLLALGVERLIWYSYDDTVSTGMGDAARDEWGSLADDLIGRRLMEGTVTITDQRYMSTHLQFEDGGAMTEVFDLGG